MAPPAPSAPPSRLRCHRWCVRATLSLLLVRLVAWEPLSSRSSWSRPFCRLAGAPEWYLSGSSAVARDSLRLALECPPAQLQCHEGMLLNALQLLVGYGLYVSLSTICRMLDNLAPPNPHPLHAPTCPPGSKRPRDMRDAVSPPMLCAPRGQAVAQPLGRSHCSRLSLGLRRSLAQRARRVLHLPYYGPSSPR